MSVSCFMLPNILIGELNTCISMYSSSFGQTGLHLSVVMIAVARVAFIVYVDIFSECMLRCANLNGVMLLLFGIVFLWDSSSVRGDFCFVVGVGIFRTAWTLWLSSACKQHNITSIDVWLNEQKILRYTYSWNCWKHAVRSARSRSHFFRRNWT